MAVTWHLQILALAATMALAAALDPRTLRKESLVSHLPDDGPKEVERLPGFDGPLPSLHRAGYVTVAPAAGRRLYYYLVNSESKHPDRDPLVIWLTGGPGCSSLDAFTYENGPFRFHIDSDDVTLSRNPYAWSRVAHVLYVDSPAGTGMSYSTDPEDDYQTDDHQTIEDLLHLVLGVLRDIPDLRDKDLYIAGESYGGVYVPMLADRILRHNSHVRTAAAAAAGERGGSVDGREHGRLVNLVGYTVGNGVTDDEVDGNSQIPYAWGAGLLDRDTHAFVETTCEGAFWNATRGTKCWDALELMDGAIGAVNPYDLGSDCFFPRPSPQGLTGFGGGADEVTMAGSSGSGDGAEDEEGKLTGRVWPFVVRFEAGKRVSNWWTAGGARREHAAAAAAAEDDSGSSSKGGAAAQTAAVAAGRARPGQMLGHTVPCADRRAALAYYNDPEVRRAIHAVPSKESGRWEPCSDVLHYTHTAPSMIAVHRRLLVSGLRALVYSGLRDYVVPFTGTRAWTAGLALQTEFPWRPWKLGRQVAGHVVRYRGEGEGEGRLTYATVIGAGHMVPSGAPEAALGLLRSWLRQEV